MPKKQKTRRKPKRRRKKPELDTNQLAYKAVSDLTRDK